MARPGYELTRCPACGGAAAREIADRAAIRDEVERLWEFHGRRLRLGIPSERLTDRMAFSQHAPLRVVECRACGHVYRNPREREDALRDAYATPVSAAGASDGVFRALFETQRAAYRSQMRRLVRAAGAHGRGVEVGSYVGGFLAAAREAGWDFTGVDVSAEAAAFAAREGFTVVTGTLADLPDRPALDAIAIWNTFEQLYDAREAARLARSRLRDGGTLAVRVPNGSFYARWSGRLGGPLGGVAVRVLAHNNLLSFPYRQGFSERSMSRLLGEAGFRIVRVFGDVLVPIADCWTTRWGALDERLTKRIERLAERGWSAPWVEVYARAV